MRTLTDEEKKKLMDDLVSSLKMSHTQLPYEMTLQEFADAIGYKYETARKIIAKKIKAEEMTTRYIFKDGKRIAVYSVI